MEMTAKSVDEAERQALMEELGLMTSPGMVADLAPLCTTAELRATIEAGRAQAAWYAAMGFEVMTEFD